MGIQVKLIISTIIIILAVAAAILITNIVLFSGFVDATTIDRVNAATRVAINRIESLKTEASAVSSSVAGNPLILQALEKNNRDELLVYLRALKDEVGYDFCTVTDKNGIVIARTHAPEEYGDSVLYQLNVQSAVYGESVTVVEEGTLVTLSVRSGTPIVDDKGAIVGVLSAGFRLDTEEFVDSIKAMMGCELSIVFKGERIATTVLNGNGVRVTGTRTDTEIVETVMDGNSFSGRVNILENTAVAQYTPIEGFNGKPVAMIFVGQYLSQETETIMAFVQSGLVVVIVMLAVSVAVVLFIVGHILKPIRAMTAAVSAMAIGDTDLEIRVNTKDETRTLADAFNSMVENTRKQLQAVESIAAGDMTVTLTPRSDKDLMNRALEKLNVTIKAQAEEIKAEHDRTKIMLDATPMASRLWDKNFNLIECNEAVVSLFGLKNKQEYMDRYFSLSPEFQPDGRESYDKSMSLLREAFNKGVCTYEWVYQLPDGSPMPAEGIMVRVPYGDGFAVAGYSRDLREQKKMIAEIESTSKLLAEALAEAEAANSAKTTFLAQMSHEIRTPLNAVVGLSELALDSGELGTEMEERLEKIHTSGMTILSIVNDILDISKIESGKFEIYLARYDTPSLINDIVTLNIVRIGEKPIDFELTVSEDFPALLFGDDLRIKQIFNNLLSNAFKYTESGTVTWDIGFERDGRDIWLVSSVRDSGIGIKKEDMEKLFADYKQVGADMNRKVEGTGLGLPIAKRLIEMMDGTITVESEFGKGTTFSVRLRQGFVSETTIGKIVADNLMGLRYTIARRRKSVSRERIDLSYAHVLVVDDISTNLDVVKGMLKPYKLKVDCAVSGYEAIARIRSGSPRYSAVFMDHMMPGMDGIEATRAIREEINTGYARDIPVIALTANALIGNKELFLNNGFQDFISKPIDMNKLDAVLRRWVRDKGREKEITPDGTETPAPEREGSLFSGTVINGLDIDKALERFSGDEEVLADVFRSYVEGTKPVLEKLDGFMRTGDLREYYIAVHGIKGSSYGILAQEVGAMAEKLEKAAGAGDAETVRTGHGAFKAKAEALLDDIENALNKIDGRAGNPAEPGMGL